MNDWSNVLDSILDIIPTVSEQLPPATVVTPAPVAVAVDLTSDLDFSAPVTPEMLRHAGLSQPAPEKLVKDSIQAENIEKHSVGADLGNLPPMRMVSERPALPRDLWLGGLTPAEALAAHGRLSKEYFCSCGADAGGWFVRCDPVHYAVEVAPTAEFSAMAV